MSVFPRNLSHTTGGFRRCSLEGKHPWSEPVPAGDVSSSVVSRLLKTPVRHDKQEFAKCWRSTSKWQRCEGTVILALAW